MGKEVSKWSWSNRLFVTSVVLAVLSGLLTRWITVNAGSSRTDFMIGTAALMVIAGLAGTVASLLFVKPPWKKGLVTFLFAVSALVCAVSAVIALAMVGG